MSKVAYAECSFSQDFSDTLENVRAAKGSVDFIVVVEDGSFSEEQKKAFRDEGVALVFKEWGDNFPAYRNASLDAARNLGADWVIVSDADEHMSSEVWRDLKPKLIPELEARDLTMAGIRCLDAFDAIEWWDDLDQLKELPGGSARESTFYKNQLYRLYLKGEPVKFSGVGQTQNVHEVWGAVSEDWRSVKLPAPYSYTHRKSSLRIWRNAARNLVMGGGGDNVGDVNEMWVELREIMKEDMHIDSWPEFEKFITSGKELPKSYVDWVRSGLVWKASDYGTEVRETAKWTAYWHRELLKDTAIEHGVHNPPKQTEDDKIESDVRKLYFLVLHRHPDRGGLTHYTEAVKKGDLTLKQLHDTLKNSKEYLTQVAPQEEKGSVERVGIPINGQLTWEITDAQLVSVLQRSRTWNEEVKPALDIGRALLALVPRDKRKPFLQRFYEKKDNVALMLDEPEPVKPARHTGRKIRLDRHATVTLPPKTAPGMQHNKTKTSEEEQMHEEAARARG